MCPFKKNIIILTVISPAVATEGIGLHEGLEWLTEAMLTRYAQSSVQSAVSLSNTQNTERALYGWNYITCGLVKARSWLWSTDSV